MRLLLSLLLFLAAAWPAAAARSAAAARAPLPVQAALGRLALAAPADFKHLTPYAVRPGVLRYDASIGAGHYDFDARRVGLVSQLAVIPAEHAAPAAAHEFHHMHEHEAGLLSFETFGGELRAHEVQAKATRIAMTIGWLDGPVVAAESPTLGVEVPVVVPERLESAARRLFSGKSVDPGDEALIRYYRSLATTLTAYERGLLDKVVRRFYPHLLH